MQGVEMVLLRGRRGGGRVVNTNNRAVAKTPTPRSSEQNQTRRLGAATVSAEKARAEFRKPIVVTFLCAAVASLPRRSPAAAPWSAISLGVIT